MNKPWNLKIVEWEDPGMVSVYPEGEGNLRCMTINCDERKITTYGISIRTAYSWLCHARRESHTIRKWEPQIIPVEAFRYSVKLPFGLAVLIHINKLKPSDGWKIIKVRL